MADRIIDQSGQTLNLDQLNFGGDARIEHVGDKVAGDKILNVRHAPAWSEQPLWMFKPSIALVPTESFLIGSRAVNDEVSL